MAYRKESWATDLGASESDLQNVKLVVINRKVRTCNGYRLHSTPVDQSISEDRASWLCSSCLHRIVSSCFNTSHGRTARALHLLKVRHLPGMYAELDNRTSDECGQRRERRAKVLRTVSSQLQLLTYDRHSCPVWPHQKTFAVGCNYR